MDARGGRIWPDFDIDNLVIFGSDVAMKLLRILRHGLTDILIGRKEERNLDMSAASGGEVSEARKENVTKYKELFDYSTQVLDDEHERFNRADEKASKYLTVLTFLVGVIAYFDRWVIDNAVPPKDFRDWAIVVFGGIALVMAVTAWILVIGVLRTSAFYARPLNVEVLSFFREHELIDIYYAYAVGNKDALERNRPQTEMKYAGLVRAFYCMFVAGFSLIALVLLFSWKSWEQRLDSPKPDEHAFAYARQATSYPRGG